MDRRLKPPRSNRHFSGTFFWAVSILPMKKKLRGLDLNQRPSGYEPDELPSCSTPRLNYVDTNQAIRSVYVHLLSLSWCCLRSNSSANSAPFAPAPAPPLFAASGCFCSRPGHTSSTRVLDHLRLKIPAQRLPDPPPTAAAPPASTVSRVLRPHILHRLACRSHIPLLHRLHQRRTRRFLRLTFSFAAWASCSSARSSARCFASASLSSLDARSSTFPAARLAAACRIRLALRARCLSSSAGTRSCTVATGMLASRTPSSSPPACLIVAAAACRSANVGSGLGFQSHSHHRRPTATSAAASQPRAHVHYAAVAVRSTVPATVRILNRPPTRTTTATTIANSSDDAAGPYQSSARSTSAAAPVPCSTAATRPTRSPPALPAPAIPAPLPTPRLRPRASRTRR